MDEQYYFRSAAGPASGGHLKRTSAGKVDCEQRLRLLPVSG